MIAWHSVVIVVCKLYTRNFSVLLLIYVSGKKLKKTNDNMQYILNDGANSKFTTNFLQEIYEVISVLKEV